MTVISFDEPTGLLMDSDVSMARFSDSGDGGDNGAGDSPSPASFIVPGKLFQTGTYPKKNFTFSDSDAAAEVQRFNNAGVPAPMNYAHKKGVLDGKLGAIRRIWKKGAEVWADFEVPEWFAKTTKASGAPLRVSAEFNKLTKQLTAAAWVIDPHIKDAQLVAFHDEYNDDNDNSDYDRGDSRLSGRKGSNMKTKEERIAALIAEATAKGEDVDTAAITALFSEDATRLETLEKENRTLKAGERKARAESFANDCIRVKKKAFPSERGGLIALFSRLEEDDEADDETVSFSAGSKTYEGSRVDALKTLVDLRAPHNFTDEMLTNDADGKKLSAEFHRKNRAVFSEQDTPEDGDDKPLSPEREAQLLGYTPLGVTILTDSAKGN